MMSDYISEVRRKVGNDLLVMPSVAVAIKDGGGRLLLVKHHNRGLWVLPGGLVEPGELPADAALREVWEETGLAIRLRGIIGVYGGPDLFVTYVNGDRASYVGIIFGADVTGGKLRPDGQEILDAQYFRRSEIGSLPHRVWLERVLPHIFDSTGIADFQAGSWEPPEDSL